MKKTIALILCILSFFSLIGCLGDAKTPAPSTESVPSVTTTEAAFESSETATAPETTIPPSETLETELSSAVIETEPPTEPPTEPTTEAPTEPPTEPVPVMTDDSTFEIYFLDVGQGDAAYILCDGKAMLIDGGPSSESDLIYSFLKSHGVTHLDYIVATHPDADHVGGLAGALNYATVGTAYCTVAEYDSKPFNAFLKYLGRRDGEITVPSSGDSFYLGCSKVTILFPDAGTTWSDNTSIALRIEYGDTSFLFTGDCEAEDEAVFLANGFDLKSNVLKVAHHGSKYSTGSDLLRSVDPEFAVISVGGDNTYGHPTDEVLSRLSNKGVALFRTDIHGDVHCTSDGKRVVFDVEKNADVDAYITAGGYKNYLDELAAQASEPPPDRTIPGENEDPEETEARITYIANTNTGKFHYPSCSSVGQMKESNKWYFTGTRDELIEMGYKPCGRCNP